MTSFFKINVITCRDNDVMRVVFVESGGREKCVKPTGGGKIHAASTRRPAAKSGAWKRWQVGGIVLLESPFFTLGAEIVFQPIEHILHDTDENKHSCSTQSGIANLEKQKEEVFTPSVQIPKPAFPKRTAVTRCCYLLSRIKTLVHECTNSTSLANLEKTLLSALTELEDSRNTDAGLTLVAPDTGEKSRKRNRVSQTTRQIRN